jgi:hypothetical protein
MSRWSSRADGRSRRKVGRVRYASLSGPAAGVRVMARSRESQGLEIEAAVQSGSIVLQKISDPAVVPSHCQAPLAVALTGPVSHASPRHLLLPLPSINCHSDLE